jgi:uncharacterized RDD family membrane protein YckC
MPWYYAVGAVRNGPVEDDAFQELVKSQVIGDSTLVWREGMRDWEPFANLRPQVVPPPAPPSRSQPAPPSAGPAFCTQCGRAVGPHELVAVGGRLVCASCQPLLLQQIREGAGSSSGLEYAGFWIRVAAILIDAVALSVVNWVLSMALFGSLLVSAASPERIGAALAGVAAFYLVAFIVALGYEIFFTAQFAATLGKMALGLKVIRGQGGPITYGLSTGRYFSKIISGMIFGIGYMMAGWDPEKRALHDRICDTRVIRAR